MADREIISRLTRIETRLTKFLTEQGFDAGARKPLLNGDTIIAPNKHVSLHNLMEVAAKGDAEDGYYDVYVDGSLVCTILVEVDA